MPDSSPYFFGRPQFVQEEVYRTLQFAAPIKQNSKTRKSEWATDVLHSFHKAATNTLPTRGSQTRFRLQATQPLPGSAGRYRL
jgi:hypothetical protein